MLGFNDNAVGDHLWVRQHLRPGQDRSAGDTLLGQPVQPLLPGARLKRFLGHGQPFVDVTLAQRWGLEPSVLQPLRLLQRSGQRDPFAVGLHCGADRECSGLIDQVDKAGSLLLRNLLTDKGLDAHVGGPEKRNDRVQHGQPDMLTLAGPFAGE